MRDVDGFAVAESVELRPAIDAFSHLTWPRPADEVPVFAEQLGWQMTREVAGKTTLPVNRPDVRFLVIDDELVEVKFNVSDSLSYDVEIDAEGTARLRGAFTLAKTELRALLGDPVGTRGGLVPSAWWDLASGGRVRVEQLSHTVLLILASRRAADIERTEAQFGISPDRVTR